MKTNWFAVVIMLFAGFIAWSAWPNVRRTLDRRTQQLARLSEGYNQGVVVFSDNRINVQIPTTTALQELGLGGRSTMGDEQGMLWLFDEARRYSFWMKGMKFPLDFIWIDGGRVVDITPDAPVPSAGDPDPKIYQPAVPASAILEVNAGFAQRHAVHVGDAVEVDPR